MIGGFLKSYFEAWPFMVAHVALVGWVILVILRSIKLDRASVDLAYRLAIRTSDDLSRSAALPEQPSDGPEVPDEE